MFKTLFLTYPAVLSLSLALAVAQTPADGTSDGKNDSTENPAVNNPDKFAWELFVQINQLAEDRANSVIWETWADDIETFPPNPNPAKPPRWPGAIERPKTLRPSRQLEIFRNQIKQQFGVENPHPLIPALGSQEEVRRNKPAFDFIVANKLWYLDGIVAAYKAGRTVVFPVEAIEIKAHWKQIKEKDKPRYHWNIDQSGKLYGLIALHISSKALPNWFWATFEHVDNPDRGKVLGCRDSLGVEPPNSCDGKVSPILRDMFRKAGMGAEWQNYRLDGCQTAFTDSTGRPTLLGNSQIEGPFITTSSCITCHAKAACDGNGLFLSVFKSNNPLEGDVGTPNPDWFYNSGGSRKRIQMDFVWGFLSANPVGPGK